MFNNIIAAIKTNNVKKFDTLINNLSTNSNYNNEYKNYIHELKKNTSLTKSRISNTNANYFQIGDVNSIKLIMNMNNFNISTCEVVASSDYENEQARFGCKGTSLELTKLNETLKALVQTDSRFVNTNCTTVNNILYCEGPLKTAQFTDLSPIRQKKVTISNNEQRSKTFKGTTEHF